MHDNRVKETTTTTGTGNLTLAGAATNFQSFNSAKGVGPRFFYYIEDSTNNIWEHGIGYLSGTTTLVRDLVLDNSSGTTSALNLSAGTKDVFIGVSPQSGMTCTGKIATNKWMLPVNLYGNGYRATLALVADRIHYFPIYLQHANDIDAIRLSVSTAAGTKMRLGIYTNVDGLPADLLFETSDLDPSTTGIKSASVTQTNVSGEWLWGAVVSDGATVVHAADYTSSYFNPCYMLDADTYKITGFYETSTSWTTLPSSAGTLTDHNRQHAPRLQVQIV